jgi:hypothetical protein
MKLNESIFFFKFALYVRDSHCGSLSQLSKNLAASLLFLLGFQTKNICANLISPIHVTCFTSLTFWCDTNDIW